MRRVNIGCGRTPTPGWINIDNSPSVLLAHDPILAGGLKALGLLRHESRKFIQMVREVRIRWGSGNRLSMLADNTVEVVYSSHMMQQLDRDGVKAFLAEIRRVLVPGGIVRLTMPDLELMIQNYMRDRDADRLVAMTSLSMRKPKNFLQRIQWILFGVRNTSLWHYDGKSLCKLLEANGFRDPCVLPPNETTIPDPGPLDLAERSHESVYVEARKAC